MVLAGRKTMEEKLVFLTEDGKEQEFEVIEQTIVAGRSYLLVSEDGDDEEAECIILKDVSSESDPEAQYVPLEDEQELNAVAAIFEKLLEDDYQLSR